MTLSEFANEICNKLVGWNLSRRNFSLVACYSLKFTRCWLLIVKSLVTRCKILSLLVAEVAHCEKLLVNRCKVCLLLVATNHWLLVAKYYSTLVKTITSP